MIKALAISLAFAAPASALTLADCDRTTHVSHGGETGHRDVGGARVVYAEWWSQEGVFTDLVIADCAEGMALKTRTKEERISARPPFDRTDKAIGILDTELAVSPSLFSFDRLAAALKGTGRDIEIAALDTQPCACAAAYPGARAWANPYEAG